MSDRPPTGGGPPPPPWGAPDASPPSYPPTGPPTGPPVGPPTGPPVGAPLGGYQPFPSTYAGWPAASSVAVPPEDPLVSRTGFNGWLAKIIAAIGRSWRRLLPVFLVGAIPQAVIAAVVGSIIGNDKINKIITNEVDANGRNVVHVDWSLARPILIAAGISLVLGGIVSVLIRAASVWVITHDAAGHPTTLGDAGRFAARRFWGLVGWQLVFGLLTGVGLVLCIVPGVYVWVLSTFVVGVVSFEGGSAWSRARALAAGSFWPLFGRVVMIAVTASIATQALGVVSQAISTATGSFAIGSGIGAFLVAPIGMLAAASSVVTYAEAKARVNGTDTANLLYDLHRP